MSTDDRHAGDPVVVGPSRLLRREVVDALRRGTVPRHGLELFAVGVERFQRAFDEELDTARTGRGVFKALRGDFGCGKSFTARWMQQRAMLGGFAAAEVQISETDTPLHRLETVYRRAMENLRTREWGQGAFRSLVDSWFYSLEEAVIAAGTEADDLERFSAAVAQLMEARLADVSAIQPQYAAVLRACHGARVREDAATLEGLIAWLMGQPNVAASIKRKAGIKGDLDHTGALAFLRGVLVLLQQTGRKGLVLVLDELETIQRVRGDVRQKSLNALRQLIDDVDAQRFPGLYVLVTGTPAFFDGPQGVKRLPPLAQRLHVDFSGPVHFENTRAVQVRLPPFSTERLIEVGKRVRDLYPSDVPERIAARVADDVIVDLAHGVSGKLGGRTGVAPRLFLRKLVSELLDKVDEHPDYDPRKHFSLVMSAREMSAEEREAAGMHVTPDDIELTLADAGDDGDEGGDAHDDDTYETDAADAETFDV